MFQLDWCESIVDEELKIESSFDLNAIKDIQYSFWAEHCLECSPPQCYLTCNYYEKRCDGRCKRTYYGQKPIHISNSIIGIGVKVKFKPWAKLETYVYNRTLNKDTYRKICNRYNRKTKLFKRIKTVNYHSILNNVSYFFRTRAKWRTNKAQNADYFLFEAISYTKQTFRIVVEAADVDWKVIARDSIEIKPGFSSHLVDYKKIAPEGTNVIRFYPENNIEAELLIINADFVTVKRKAEAAKPAKKVKCVAWDLDNTLWSGILSETDNPSNLLLRNGIKNVILELDKRGIIQTVVSKNDYDPAWNAIESLGLSEFFLYPAINWGPKSKNLEKIANELNINIDTFAVIDDSPFEREEITSVLPQVRVYDENVIGYIFDLQEFDTPSTEEASQRRKMYQTEAKRKQIQAEYDGNFLNFLRSCNMKVNIGSVNSNEVKNRCFELISRTNQLNITGHKYLQAEFEEYLKESNSQNIYFSCEDKYGNYGVVGYVSFFVKEDKILINEFAVSCRIAQKHVERAVLSWVARQYIDRNKMIINFIKTDKNMPMYNCLLESGFADEDGILTIAISEISSDEQIIEISNF